MIIPINNGRSIIPVYIPPVVTTNSGVLEQSNTNTQYNEPSLVAGVVLAVFVIFLIAFVVYFIKILKDMFGGEK